MAEALLAILLVTTSAKGSSLVYRWPPSPVSSPRLSKPRPAEEAFSSSQLDNPWRASHFTDAPAEAIPKIPQHDPTNDSEYHWQRLDATLDNTAFLPSSPSHPQPGVNPTNKDCGRGAEDSQTLDEYDHLFGYSAEFLASLLCPHRSMCHQKFELLVDDLAFIGHPVCAEEDGGWRFKPEKVKAGPRGRESRNVASPHLDDAASASLDRHLPSEKVSPHKGWLHTFHFVIVLDIPDPSSSASGNVSKYFDIIYEQVAFTVTAVLFQEQVLSNFVESECDILGSLKDCCISKGTCLFLVLRCTVLTTFLRGAVLKLRTSSFGGVIYRTCDENPLRSYQVIMHGVSHHSQSTSRSTTPTLP